MLFKSRRSSIALTLLFFFIFSIACCLPVGMAEDPPSVGGGGGGELPLLTINPTSVTVPFDGTIPITIYDNETGLWTGSDPLALHLYNTDVNGCPVDSIGGWYSANGGFSVTDSDLTVELDLLPCLQPGNYVFIVAVDNGEGSSTPLGRALFNVEGDTTTTPVTLTAIPDYGLPGNTISIILYEPVDDDLWSIQDPVIPRLVTPANPTAGAMLVEGAYFDNIIVSDDSISADLNLPETVAPGQYVIEVLLSEAVIGTAFFEVDGTTPPVGNSAAWLSTSSYETGQAWSTGSWRASVQEGYLKLGVNVENVSFTYGTFDIEYDPNIVNNPTLSYYRDEFTSCDLEIWPQENGMNTAHVEFYGATTIGAASDNPYSSDWPTLFELNFTAKQEGTLALSLWHMNLPGAQPETCLLDLFNDAGFIGYGPKASNDEPVLFTFTDKDNVVYVYDINNGQPLIGTLNAVMNDDTRVPQNVTADPYGGYFFNNVTGAKDFELLVPGYDPISLGTSAYHHVLGCSPSMLGISPHMSRPSTNDMYYTLYRPGIGSDFDTNSYTYELYYRDSNYEPQPLVKNVNFSAGDDADQIKATFIGGLEILNGMEWQQNELYIYKNDVFLGRAFFMVDENFLPYLPTDPDTVSSDYTGNITIKGFEGMQGVEPVPWVADDNLSLQLWLYNPQSEQPENTGLVPTVGTVTDTDLTFTLPQNVIENRYIIYVFRDSERIAHAEIVVENEQSAQPAIITLTPNQVNTGDSLSFQFDLSGVTLQNSPYAAVVIPPTTPDGQPTPVLLAEPVITNQTGHEVSFSQTINTAGGYCLIIFDGQPVDSNNLPPVVAVGLFMVVDANPNVLYLNLSPGSIDVGTITGFEFTVPAEFTMPANPYGLILKPGDPPVPVGNSVLLGTTDRDNQTYYTFTSTVAINEIGNYELHIFEGQPVQGSQPIAIGKFNVTPAFLPLSPPILTAGEQVSLAFDIPTNVPAADTRYAMLIEDTPEHQPVSGVTPVAITLASGSDSVWLANWPAETQLEPGNYLLAIFNAPPTLDSAPVAFGLFTVEPALFCLVTERLPLANVNQSYEATVEVANGTAPYRWTFRAPEGITLPQGMTLIRDEQDTSKAVLSFIPSQAGVLPIIIEVADNSSGVSQVVSRLYELRILPPLFDLNPNKIVAGDLLNFEFSLPEGVTVNNPYAILGNLDTGSSSMSMKVSSSEGICQVSFYPWMLDSQPSGEYYVGIMEGMPQQDTRCLAAGKFDFVQLPWVNANPNNVLMPYPSGQNICLEEPGNMPLLWNENDDLTLQFFKQEWQQDIMKLTNVPFSGSIQVLDHIINFTLPDEWSEGWYQVRVYRGEERIAISSFSVNYPWFDVNPGGVPAYFRQSPVIELWENQYEIWNAADTLEVHLVNNKGCDPESCERVLEATIPNDALSKTDDVIKFNLPASIDCGYHDVELFRGDKLIARGSLNINAPQCGVQPRPLFIDAQNKTVSLHKDDPETWHASEAGQLKLDIHQKNYYGPEPWQYNLEYKQTIESADLTVNEDTISFVFPELEKGGYELKLQRRINAEFWRTVGWGDFLYTDPPVKLQLTGDELSSDDPPTVKEDYSNALNFTLTDTAGTSWSADEPLHLDLFHFHPIEKMWNILPPHMQPYDVLVGEDSISAKLPPGIWAGDYTITVSRASTVPSEEFALGQFRVLPLLELESVNLPPAQVNQTYFGTVTVTGGTAPYYIDINSLPPEFQWPVGNMEWYPNQNDSSQLIITGTFTEPGVYPLEIRVEDNDGRVSYHPIQLVVREGMPRVIACNAIGLPGREVIAPIMGENLMGTGVSGIQFTLDYDPAVVTIAPDGVLPGMIPDISIVSNIDNVSGHAYITIAWTQPLPEQVNIAEFCRIKYQINSNPANAACTVYLNDVDGTILSHGEYDISAEVINGVIRAASYGDVNGNGKVDVGDAVLILRHSAGIINLPEPLIELADVDGIDGVGPTDAILVLKKVVRLIDHFPVELPVVL